MNYMAVLWVFTSRDKGKSITIAACLKCLFLLTRRMVEHITILVLTVDACGLK